MGINMEAALLKRGKSRKQKAKRRFAILGERRKVKGERLFELLGES
jgi:hypothetical protein